jgi:hypothetical protein
VHILAVVDAQDRRLEHHDGSRVALKRTPAGSVVRVVFDDMQAV